MPSIDLIIMAKSPLDPRITVKSRLAATAGLDDDTTRQVALAMLTCLIERVRPIAAEIDAELTIALSPDDATLPESIAADRIIPQGTGTLGERMSRAAGEQPVIFLGMDSPDLPIAALTTIPDLLRTHDLLLGPTPDGGYWVLAATPAVLTTGLLTDPSIDWGTDTVYTHTRELAAEHGLATADLPPWTDIDTASDLGGLLRRTTDTTDPPLQRLRDTLTPMTAGEPPNSSPGISASTATAPGAGSDNFGGTILLVDDNEQNLELVQAYLEDLPSEIAIATDGIAAMERIAETTPDVVLLDVMMPRMSGFEVCQRIKSNPATRDISVIMVTALNEVGDIERAVECGTNDFLTKPVNKVELLTRVRSQLELRIITRQYNALQQQMLAGGQRDIARPQAGAKLDSAED